MSLKFNIGRPPVSDEEIKKHQDFDALVKQFKQQSIKRARGDESWWRNKKIQYTTVIAGATVICTVTYLSLFNNKKTEQKHETIITQLASPTPKSPVKKFISAPSEKLNTKYSTYKVDNSKGATLTHPGSTVIKIPKHAFKDNAGHTITGDVVIEYREFHGLPEIIGSGIPMHYDSAGHNFNLESAGMFDIKGTQNGEPVQIDPGKPVTVELVSNTDEKKFNQYYLDTVARNWSYLKRDEPAEINTSKASSQTDRQKTALATKLEREINVIIPRKIDSVTSNYTKKVATLPTVRKPVSPVKTNPARPSFKLEGSYSEFPELAAFDNLTFEVGPENRNYSKDFHEITWSDIKVTPGPDKGRNYILNLAYRGRVEKLIVYPALSGKDYQKADENYQLNYQKYLELTEKREAAEQKLKADLLAKQNAYAEEQARKKAELEKLRNRAVSDYNAYAMNELNSNFNVMGNQARAKRIFEISRFGIYNSDCPHASPAGKSIHPVFVSNDGKKVLPEVIYMVDHTNKTVYQFRDSELKNISFDHNSDYTFCVFKKNTLYIYNKDQFAETVNKGTENFPVTLVAAETLTDFKKVLEL